MNSLVLILLLSYLLRILMPLRMSLGTVSLLTRLMELMDALNLFQHNFFEVGFHLLHDLLGETV